MRSERIHEAERLRTLLREQDLATYTRSAWKIIEPATPLKWNWHLDAIAEHLEAVKSGEIKRLIINIPPRNLKSIMTTICFPTWWWTTDPFARFICTSYSHGLSTKHSIARRSIIEHPWYQQQWSSRVQLADDQNTKAEFENSAKGHMIATSMQGAATGKGATCIIVDDPHDTTRASSDTMRDSDIEAFDQKFTTRLDDKKTGRIVIIMQRLHDRDLTGHLLKQGGYEHLCLPAICEEPQKVYFPVSKKTVDRNPGDVLHPSRESLEVLDQQRAQMGSWSFTGQYQQRPTAREGGIVKRQWIKFWKQLPARAQVKAQSWDMTFKDSAASDFVVGQAWMKSGGEYYLIDQTRGRMDFVASIAAVKAFSAKHPSLFSKLVEDKANGPAIIAMLKKDVSGIIPFKPEASKDERLAAVAPFFEAGNVYLPDPSIAPWVNDYIEELVNFPNAANDDQVDATTQFLLRYGDSGGYSLEKIVKL